MHWDGLIRTTPYLTSSRVNGLAAGHGSFANVNAFGTFRRQGHFADKCFANNHLTDKGI
ncbi:19573_t:CDS:2 [Rhizophagus irregularis]|nr:19573_t:CDS:2 [Rhizophagus irregularis]